MNKVVASIFLILFISCMKTEHVKIDVPNESLEKVKNAMEYVTYVLNKSTYDTTAIMDYYTEGLSEEELKKIDFNIYLKSFNKYFIYYSSDSLFLKLNDRKVNYDFKSINRLKELSSFNEQEKKLFYISLKTLTKNGIGSCYLVFDEYYEFRYSTKEFKPINYESFLYLKKDYLKMRKIIPKSERNEFIEEKNGIIICKGK